MPNKIAISIDVEDWYHSSSLFDNNIPLFEEKLKTLGDNNKNIDFVSKPTNNLLKIFDYYNIKATFFIVSHIALTNPKLIKRISESGHEIASHSMYHSEAIDYSGQPLMSKNYFLDSTRKSKKILENLCGKKVIGYRAPGAFISGWMIDQLEKIGFAYDSSVCINTLYDKSDIKPKNVTTVPYYPKKSSLESQNNFRKIIEFPWSYWYFLGLKFPTGGGPFLRYFGHRYILKGIKDSLLRGHTMLYLHPLDIACKFPGIHRRKFFWHGRGKHAQTSLLKILNYYSDKDMFTTYSNLIKDLKL